MSIEAILGGVVMIVQVATGQVDLNARHIYNTAVLIDKAIIKKEEGYKYMAPVKPENEAY